MALELPPDDDLDPLILRRRMKAAKARKRLIVMVSVGGGVLAVAMMAAVAIVVGVATTRGIFAPSPSREGNSWNHKELLDYLCRKGISPVATKGDSSSPNGQSPVLYISTDEPDLPRISSESLHFFVVHGNQGLVEITKARSSQEAKDEVGVLGSSGYSWGRFVFHGDPALVAKIRRILD